MAITQTGTTQTRPALTLVAEDALAPESSTAAGAVLPVPADVVLVPAEQVLLLRVDLPEMSAAQRRVAVAFAVEDRIAQPLDEVHVVLGPRMAPGSWLAAVVAHSVFLAYPPGKSPARLWPDVLTVPVPAAGWSVWAGAGRILVRLADGTGFATTPDLLPVFWATAGSPAVTLFGGTLPLSIPVAVRAGLPAATDPALAGFDLRAGRSGFGGQAMVPKGLRRVAAVLIVAAVGHLALMAADVVTLQGLADRREAELRAALGAAVGADLETALAQALAARQPAIDDGLLPLLTRIFSAMGDHAGRVAVQDLRYAAANDSAVLTLEAPDLGTLQAVETALNGAGLGVSAGAATTGDGAAEVQFTLQGGGA